MKVKHVQLLTRWTNPGRCVKYQMVRFTNLNANYARSITILAMRGIYWSIGLIDISDVRYTILTPIVANERKNSVVLSCMTLMNETFEFLDIRMNFNTVSMNIQKLCIAIAIFKYYNILYIPAVMIIFNENSLIAFRCWHDDGNTVEIIKIQMIQVGVFNLVFARVDMIYSIIL